MRKKVQVSAALAIVALGVVPFATFNCFNYSSSAWKIIWGVIALILVAMSVNNIVLAMGFIFDHIEETNEQHEGS